MVDKQISRKLTVKIKAVGYIRMSSGRQETSPEQQRMEIEKLAKKLGYELVRIYYDEGKSGASDHHKRTEFNRMIDDAENTNEFSVILVREQNRFSRMDMLDFFHCLRRLRDAGVKLISTKGEIKADDFVDIVTSGVEQDAARKYSINLSQEVCRGICQSAEKGRYTKNVTPYGYYRQIMDENGKVIFTVKRQERFSIAKNPWTETLVLGDPEEIEVVQWIFNDYLNRAVGLRGVANDLNMRGVLSPYAHRGNVTGMWTATSVRNIIEKRVYEGTYTFAKTQQGKFFIVTKDGPVNRKDYDQSTDKKNGSILIEDVYPPLVSKADFKEANEKMVKNGFDRGPKKRIYLLSGLLFCGRCGRKMVGHTNKSFKRYHCGLWSIGGINACGAHSISEQQLVTYLTRFLEEIVDIDRSDMKLRIDKKLNASTQKQPAQANRLQTKIGNLDADIKRAVKRMLVCEDDIVGLMTAEIAEMRSQRSVVASELASMEPVSNKKSIGPDDAMNRLGELQADLKSADRLRVKEVFRRMVNRIDLYFDEDTSKKTHRYALQRGVITLKKQVFEGLGDVQLNPLNCTPGELVASFSGPDLKVIMRSLRTERARANKS